MTMQTIDKDSSLMSTPSSATPLHVLLVDDIMENLSLLEEVLTDQGYVTTTASSGVEALELLQGDPAHIIVADAMMPSIDGFQLCKEVKQSPQLAHIPFIIYTGNYVDAEDEMFAKSIGVDAYVMKYDGLATLVQAVNSLAHRVYGKRGTDDETTQTPSSHALPASVDDHQFLERHHAIIVKKLEEKMHELEVYAETLSRKNREIQASEARYRNLFEHASIGIFVLDRNDGKVLDVNAEGLSLLGYSREELANLPPLAFVNDPETGISIRQSGAYFTKETQLKRKDGSLLDVELGAGPFMDQQSPRILLYMLDISEQKRMRHHLLQSEKMAFMGRLAASIAHDIRNPLAAISLNLQYLAKRLPDDFPDRGALNFAIEGSQRIGKVIENTLSLARVTPPKVQPEQLNTIVQSAVGFLNTACAQKKVVLDTQLDPSLPLVHVEAKQIEQVVLNLIQNAIDVAPERSTVLVSTCMVEDLVPRTAEIRRRAAVVVLDRGPGLSQEAMKHLFEPFHTTKKGGTGLGLALSKQIMDKHNAEIKIEPAVGGGTIARLIFPLNNDTGEKYDVQR